MLLEIGERVERRLGVARPGERARRDRAPRRAAAWPPRPRTARAGAAAPASASSRGGNRAPRSASDFAGSSIAVRASARMSRATARNASPTATPGRMAGLSFMRANYTILFHDGLTKAVYEWTRENARRFFAAGLSKPRHDCYISRRAGVSRASRFRWFDAGWSSPVARQAHNLKVVGSNPTPATIKDVPPSPEEAAVVFCWAKARI